MSSTVTQHTLLATGRWHEMSLAEQMGNIGSEIHRAHMAEEQHPERFEGAYTRALELMDATIADPRWAKRLFELCRARDMIADAALGGHEYGATFKNLEPYFDQFAFAHAQHSGLTF